jgi:hypothetical protein
MTCEILNNKLISEFPELKTRYDETVSWQDGDKTGSHTVYSSVFKPYIFENFNCNNETALRKIFAYIEKIFVEDDNYSRDVILCSIFEEILDTFPAETVMPFLLQNSLHYFKIVKES